MSISSRILTGASWTIGLYICSLFVRFGNNIVLSRILMPDVFGIMLIVSTIRMGLELVTDIGVGQSVVNNPNGENREFYCSAWTIQICRGFLLGTAIFLLSFPIASFYELPARYIQITALTTFVMSLQWVGPYLAQKRMQAARLNIFDFVNDVIAALMATAFSMVAPTATSLLIAGVVSACIKTASSFAVAGGPPKLVFHSTYNKEIVAFGKWIFLSSLFMFFCSNFDRLYFGRVLGLEILGVFGVARSLADIPAFLGARLGYLIVFPLVSSGAHEGRKSLRGQIGSTRWTMLVLGALSLALATSFSDILVRLVYDHRYVDASWILPILLVGVWFTVLSSVSEYTLMGLGRPDIGFIGSAVKLGFFLVGLPLIFHVGGFSKSLLFVAVSDLGRYLPSVVGLRRERLSFVRQDISATAIFLGAIGLITAVRAVAGYGNPFSPFFLR